MAAGPMPRDGEGVGGVVLMLRALPPNPQEMRARFETRPVELLLSLDPPKPPLTYASLRDSSASQQRRTKRRPQTAPSQQDQHHEDGKGRRTHTELGLNPFNDPGMSWPTLGGGSTSASSLESQQPPSLISLFEATTAPATVHSRATNRGINGSGGWGQFSGGGGWVGGEERDGDVGLGGGGVTYSHGGNGGGGGACGGSDRATAASGGSLPAHNGVNTHTVPSHATHNPTPTSNAPMSHSHPRTANLDRPRSSSTGCGGRQEGLISRPPPPQQRLSLAQKLGGRVSRDVYLLEKPPPRSISALQGPLAPAFSSLTGPRSASSSSPSSTAAAAAATAVVSAASSSTSLLLPSLPPSTTAWPATFSMEELMRQPPPPPPAAQKKPGKKRAKSSSSSGGKENTRQQQRQGGGEEGEGGGGGDAKAGGAGGKKQRVRGPRAAAAALPERAGRDLQEQDDEPRQITTEDFLEIERCEECGEVGMALIFSDLSSTLSTTTKKYCTPKSACNRWHCACDKHIRADRSVATALGAVFVLYERQHDQQHGEEGRERPPAIYFLPVCPSARSKRRHAIDRFTLPRLPNGMTLSTSFEERWMGLGDLLCRDNVVKVCFNAQVALMPLLGWLMSRDENHPSFIQSLADPKIAAWLGQTTMKESELEFASLVSRFITDQSSLPKPPELRPGEAGGSVTAAIREVSQTLRIQGVLWSVLKDKLCRDRCDELFMQVEMPLVSLLSSMEVHGVGFQADDVPPLLSVLDKKRAELVEQIHKAAGCAFNVDSPEQVADVLYRRLKLPCPSNTDPGKKHASTSEDILTKLQSKHPVPGLVVRHRHLSKVMHSYLEPFPVHATTEGPMAKIRPGSTDACPRIHAQWNHTQVRTGRLSSNKPALQTVPKPFDVEGVAVNIRGFICASEGMVLLSADYSQIEMRILAHCSGDDRLKELFHRQGDIYRLMMSDLLRKAPEDVTEVEREQAKVVCLGIMYGMGSQAAASKLNITHSEAQGLIRRYLNTYPKIESFIESTRAFARHHGHVKTLLGRYRYIPNIRSTDSNLRAQAERQAVNSVIQGTASDIMKVAMIRVQRAIDRAWVEREMPIDRALPPKPVLALQIHDELVYDCPASQCEMVMLRGLIKRCMEQDVLSVLPMSVPLVVNMSVGRTLGALRPVVV